MVAHSLQAGMNRVGMKRLASRQMYPRLATECASSVVFLAAPLQSLLTK
ncbi:hypothetical protein S7335_2547 [Synechococcus sp. PCC 7335]|nr:hypothetical protein S7335_2547 [Synechococcus sp. PCC 7335]